jgi:Domain of unknown function (DUF4365)
METLQIGYLHAVAAAAGCTLASPTPDRGFDWNVSHEHDLHTVDSEPTIKVQLKSTSQIAPHPDGDTFAITLENDHLRKLAQSPVTIPRLLVAMIIPRDIGDWVTVEPDYMTLRHCAYWANLEGHPITGATRTTVRVNTQYVFDDQALCRIMQQVGAGVTPG